MVAYQDKSIEFYAQNGTLIRQFAPVENTQHICISQDWKFLIRQFDDKISFFPLGKRLIQNTIDPVLDISTDLPRIGISKKRNKILCSLENLHRKGSIQYSSPTLCLWDYSKKSATLQQASIDDSLLYTQDWYWFKEPNKDFESLNGSLWEKGDIQRDSTQHYLLQSNFNDNHATLLDNRTQINIQTFPQKEIRFAIFSPDQKYILTSSSRSWTKIAQTKVWKTPWLYLEEDIAHYPLTELIRHGLQTFN